MQRINQDPKLMHWQPGYRLYKNENDTSSYDIDIAYEKRGIY